MNSPFAWPGGKRNLKKTLLSLIPEHDIYVEVFAGSAKLLFAKPQSRCEVMNDLNGDVTNFFRVAKHRPAALAEMFDHEIVHAERFKDLRRKIDLEDELHPAQLFASLADLRGSFLMSFDDCAEVRSLAKRHSMQVRRVEVGYTLASSAEHRGNAAEVLISNRPIKLAA